MVFIPIDKDAGSLAVKYLLTKPAGVKSALLYICIQKQHTVFLYRKILHTIVKVSPSMHVNSPSTVRTGPISHTTGALNPV